MSDTPSSANVPYDQIDQLLAAVAKLKQAGQGASVVTLDSLGLTSPEFSASQFYPSPTQFTPDTGLTANELAYLIWFYRNHWIPILVYRDVYDFTRTFGALVQGALQAKASFSGATIGASLFIREPRPETVFANGGTAVHNWIVTSATLGWNSPYFTVNLNETSSTADINTANNVAMLVIGIAELDSNKGIVAYKWFDQTGNGLGVRQATEAQFGSTSGLLPGEMSIYIDKNQTWKLDVNFSAAGTFSVALIGAEFVTPAIWNSE